MKRFLTAHRHARWACIGILSILLIGIFTQTSEAIPSFSLLTGTRCSACHFDPQGSGLRTELGWSMMSQTGIYHWNGEDTSGNPITNMLFKGMIVPGGDARFQLVRDSKTNQELLIPMQLSTSIGIIPTEQLSIYTDINWASIYVRQVMSTKDLFGAASALYPGETDYDLAIQYQPDIKLPSIRVGMIEPSIGIRQDDHTLFTSMDAINNVTLIPPYYNDMGAELTYEGIRWLTVNAGVFSAYNLSQIDATIGSYSSVFDFHHPSVSARVVLWPQLLDQGFNTEFGASVLENGGFKLYDGFGGIGLADKATIFIEGLYGIYDKAGGTERIVRNFSVIGTMELTPWLMPEWRFDWGQTEGNPAQSLGWGTGFLFGLEFFPAPYIELRPEYRVTDINPFGNINGGTHIGQWTGQIHIFY